MPQKSLTALEVQASDFTHHRYVSSFCHQDTCCCSQLKCCGPIPTGTGTRATRATRATRVILNAEGHADEVEIGLFG